MVLALVSSPALAKKKPKAPKVEQAAVQVLAPETLAKARLALASEQDSTVLVAAKLLGESGASNAAAPLVELLVLGARPPVVAAALDALGRLKDPSSVEVLGVCANNRNPELRRAAVEALAGIEDARVADILIDRLGDAVPDVRKAAAVALGARRESRAQARLVALVRRNDAEAAPALGNVAAPETVLQIVESHETIDDGVLAATLGAFLKRPDVPDEARETVVGTLARLPGAGAIAALTEYVAAAPDTPARPSKATARKVLKQRSAKP